MEEDSPLQLTGDKNALIKSYFGDFSFSFFQPDPSQPDSLESIAENSRNGGLIKKIISIRDRIATRLEKIQNTDDLEKVHDGFFTEPLPRSVIRGTTPIGLRLAVLATRIAIVKRGNELSNEKTWPNDHLSEEIFLRMLERLKVEEASKIIANQALFINKLRNQLGQTSIPIPLKKRGEGKK